MAGARMGRTWSLLFSPRHKWRAPGTEVQVSRQFSGYRGIRYLVNQAENEFGFGGNTFLSYRSHPPAWSGR